MDKSEKCLATFAITLMSIVCLVAGRSMHEKNAQETANRVLLEKSEVYKKNVGDFVYSKLNGKKIMVCSDFHYGSRTKPYFWGKYENMAGSICEQSFYISEVSVDEQNNR